MLPSLKERLPRLSTAAAISAAAALLAGALLVTTSFLRRPCSAAHYSPLVTPDLASAAVHYATSSTVPQQSRAEISLSLAVLRRRSPCNFLVFGLGRDSVLWYALNAGGNTTFLEEDPTWFRSVTADSPFLRAHTVRYRTHLSEADELLREYKKEANCMLPRAHLRGNERCRLALENLPDDVYEREWDVIMIDAPKGYYAQAPGRMAAIYSAAVMARQRKGNGETDIFLHDINRKVERIFANEFLCEKYRVGRVGRLWHFRIPSLVRRGNDTIDDPSPVDFC